MPEEHQDRVKQLQAELGAKEDLISRKQAELSRANQKHYELEQELAFYKIDTKFTSLHRKPETPSLVVSKNMGCGTSYIGGKKETFWLDIRHINHISTRHSS